ncbi:diacylglycerol/lipid kinase family protein [Phenylobacterium sp.]|uniref:diacylglycerol/lipid kinase family protein n=1 Tax=Phenylobacterium sp. TaxID=1871053 RepID=UPI002C05F7E7|nr:diacylglycerol kinase family protein [Phenylobacterium sp.]HVI32874.1 diacylglycerol kinase family protein [Phenylobacterium sp.]
MRAGVIRNPKSHRNRRNMAWAAAPEGTLFAKPKTKEALAEALAGFAGEGVDTLVIDGGDGTVRDVLTRLPAAFGERRPRLAVVPSGKTNVLAEDLGVPADWTVEAALQRALEPGRPRASRPCVEVVRRDGSERRRGFIFGTGAYVRATRLAQSAHRMGAFGTASVALTLAASVVQSMAGRSDRGWRAGEGMRLALGGGGPTDGARFLVIASTLETLPLGLKPFGPVRPGLKALAIEAPPRRLVAALPPLWTGAQPAWLEDAGYVRRDGDLEVDFQGEYVLDGEAYRAGALTVRQGPVMEFVT